MTAAATLPPPGEPRAPLVDGLKAVASQLIVLHHLAFYGPISDETYKLAPGLVAWFSEYARIAVQAFLVVGGFLAARGLAPHGVLVGDKPYCHVLGRYIRLATPYAAALTLAIFAAFLARHWLHDDFVPEVPTAMQVVAHLFLLHDVLGYDALSAGAWYVAIDFQLFLALFTVLWLARRFGRPDQQAFLGIAAVAGLALASAFHFNRDADWDAWAVYFFAAYALGAGAYWASRSGNRLLWLGLMTLVALTALAIEFRLRIAVALAVALALGLSANSRPAGDGSRLVAYLARISYSVFLVHFPVCLLVNAAFDRFAPGDPILHAIGLLVAWAASVAMGAVFHHGIEAPLAGRLGRAACRTLAAQSAGGRCRPR